MDKERWQRLEELFLAAEALPAPARSAFLDRELPSPDDHPLRQELEEMLTASAELVDPGLVEAGVAQAIAREAGAFEENSRPRRLGPYRIGEEIGRGGMATVYLGTRDDQAFEKKVAVKVLQRGMDSPEIVERLRRERQILANLDHPYIARLLDGGWTEDGQPYVVMEHIAGEPIDLFCERRALDLRERLTLFRKVCEAVHHAHRNLVLHRDIKPSNILVDAQGVPHLLDFGIAKILLEDLGGDGASAGLPEPTSTGLQLLTPGWASPEQVRREPLTTASDVYSLGLLLYLLVCGRRAYRVDRLRPAEVEHLVCEVVPPPPGLSDELDLVVMTALHKESGRRYASAEQLSEDVRRYLEDLPLMARKDTVLYRAGKFVRRHRLGVSVAFLVALSLLGAALFARHQAQVARDQQKRAEEVALFLMDLFESSDPDQARGRALLAREVLDQGVQRMRYSLRGDNPLRADLLSTMGRVYRKLALYDEAEKLLEEALELRGGQAAAGAEARSSLRDLAALAQSRGLFDEAAVLAKEVLEIERRQGRATLEQAESLLLLAEVEMGRGRFADAEPLYREAITIREQRLGPRSAEVAATRNSLGELLFRQGAVDAAAAEFSLALEIRRQVLGNDHPAVATSLNNLAAVLQARGELEKAGELFADVVAIRQRVFGPRHPYVALALSNLAFVDGQRRRYPQAMAGAEAALAIHRQIFGEKHAEVAAGLHNLGTFYLGAGQREPGIELLFKALDLRREVLGAEHPQTAQSLRVLAQALESSDPGRAEDFYRQALELDRRSFAPGDPRIALGLGGLGRLAFQRCDYAAAETYFREEKDLRSARQPPDPLLAQAELWLARSRDKLSPGVGKGCPP